MNIYQVRVGEDKKGNTVARLITSDTRVKVPDMISLMELGWRTTKDSAMAFARNAIRREFRIKEEAISKLEAELDIGPPEAAQ